MDHKTPRTDAAWVSVISNWMSCAWDKSIYGKLFFTSRELESELSAANDRLAALEADGKRLRRNEMSKKPLTPHQKIMRAAEKQKGLRLTAKEVLALSQDDAIATCAANDDEEAAALSHEQQEEKREG